MVNPAIEAEGLVKRYGTTVALDRLDLAVPAGTVLGLLGPNGAGKTTTVRILASLLRPDAGRAVVAGHDVVRRPDLVRRSIGLSGQYAAVDENLTGRENLVLFGRLHRLRAARARARADELLEQFHLVDAADRVVKGYSGGMRRRLDLAAGLIARPAVIFLDEPTTGLDPRARMDMWEAVRGLVADGATLLLTTQYLEEADALADEILIVDHGRAVARGTPDQLKAQVGDEHLEVVVAAQEDLARAELVLKDAVQVEDRIDVQEATRTLVAPVRDGVGALAEVSAGLAAAGVPTRGLSLRRPTLDEVFLTLTERAPAPAAGKESAP
ncbi:ATP-binding cassette domain-containing protein [Thermomonospora cellulosilytica]|uniref:ATP-binding cassette domain-containing protein n=1 Tax=Thermomonospora cellulosilytica TaxID=1411118 RepID=UPI001C71A659|nr:ATP-binding cassette domain-containing protein [Thermomonospora cellulosilytica]